MNSQTSVLETFAYTRHHYHGPVKRKDGALVPFGIDSRPLTWYPKTFRTISLALAKEVRKLKPEAIAGGLTGGAIWASAVAMILNKPFILLRKKPRGYSIDYGLIEGNVRPAMKVVLVDDSFITGSSSDFFCQALRRAKVKIIGLVVTDLVLSQLGRRWSKTNHIPIKYLVTYQDKIDYFYQRGYIDKDMRLLSSAFIKNPYGWQKNKKLWQIFKAKLKQSSNWRVIK
jgi:orotate phosphoribosyltransferase